MKFVLVVWTLWMTGGVPTVDVKSTEVYYPSMHACELAMEDRAQRYEPHTRDGFGYTMKCMEREYWESIKGTEAQE